MAWLTANCISVFHFAVVTGFLSVCCGIETELLVALGTLIISALRTQVIAACFTRDQVIGGVAFIANATFGKTSVWV